MNKEDLIILRKKSNLTQKDLADMLGVAPNTVYNYEKGGKIPESKIAILERLMDSCDTTNNGIINTGNAKKINQNNNNGFDFSSLIDWFTAQLNKKDEQIIKKDEQIDKLLNLLGNQ